MNASAEQGIAVRHHRSGRRSRRKRATRLLAGGIAAALLPAALPAVAGATDYCVQMAQTCDPSHEVPTFEKALDLADDGANADRIFLGAGTFTASNAFGFNYYGAGPVEIVGHGAGQTTLTGPEGGNPWVLGLVGGPGSSVHDLTIRLPKNALSTFTGLHTSNAARRIEVVEDPTSWSASRSGVELTNGGTLEDSSVTLDGQQPTIAVFALIPGGAVRHSALNARVGFQSRGGMIERSQVRATDTGVNAVAGATAIAATAIRMTGNSGAGIFAAPDISHPTTLTADGVTIVGAGVPNTYGAGASTEPAAESVTLNLTNSIIRGFPTALYADGVRTGAQTTVAASYSDYDPSANIKLGPNAKITQTNVSNVGDARFADAAGGDYRLLPGSPLIDTGDPATPQALDLNGNPLVADGNGDGGARRDLGAFEVQPAPGTKPGGPAGQPGGALDTRAPLVSGLRATPSVFRQGHRTRLRFKLSEAGRVKVTIRRAVAGRYRKVGRLARTRGAGLNRIRVGGRIGKRKLLPGRYRAVVVATDAAGNHSKARGTRFRIVAN